MRQLAEARDVESDEAPDEAVRVESKEQSARQATVALRVAAAPGPTVALRVAAAPGATAALRVAAARGPMGALSLAAAVGSMTTRGQRAVPRSPAPRQRQRLLLVRRARRQRAAIPVARAPVLRPIRPAHRTRHPRLNSLIVVPLRGREAPAAERFRCWRARTATARRVLPSSPWRRQPADPEPAPSRGPAVHRQWRGLRSTSVLGRRCDTSCRIAARKRSCPETKQRRQSSALSRSRPSDHGRETTSAPSPGAASAA